MSRTMRSAPLADKLAALRDHTREDLAERWAAIYGRPPPAGVRRELLCHAVAWHMQAKHLGGLSSETRRQLGRAVESVVTRRETTARLANAGATVMPRIPRDAALGGLGVSYDDHVGEFARFTDAPSDGLSIAPNRESTLSSRCVTAGRRSVGRGARLLRNWNGRTHVVDVVDGGYLYDGKMHRSLSAIARLITGAGWSGPRFFGL